MSRGATLTQPLETVLLVQRSLTVALSGYNAFYFATYRSPRGRRRLGAMVLTLINLAIGAESLAFGLVAIAIAKSSTGFTLGSQLSSCDKPAASAAGFYSSALSRAERMRLPKARLVEAMDEEIALLRVRLHRVSHELPEQFELLLKVVNTLVRAVALKYKL